MPLSSEFTARNIRIERSISISQSKKYPGSVRENKNVYFFEERKGKYVERDSSGKLTEARKDIERLLHLSANEFSKIILLPPGGVPEIP